MKILDKDSDDFYKEISERIQVERNRRKITLEVLGQHLKVSRATVNNLEKGRHRPSIYQLIQIANLFDINYTDLIPFTYDTPPKKSKKNKDEDNFGRIVTDQALGETGKHIVSDFLSKIKTEKK